MWEIIILVTLINTVINYPMLQTKSGELTITGAKNCSLLINRNYDNPIIISNMSDNYIHKYLTFGLIEYDCDGITGSLISVFECKECGLYCSHNQRIEHCREDLTIMIASMIITIILVFVIFSLTWKEIYSISVVIIDFTLSCYHGMKIKSDYRRAKKIFSINANSKVTFKNRVKGKYGDKVDKTVSKHLNTYQAKITDKINKNNQPVYIELNEVNKPNKISEKNVEEEIVIDIHPEPSTFDNTQIDIKESKTTDNISEVSIRCSPKMYPSLSGFNSRRSSTNSVNRALCAALILSSGIHEGQGCDNNLFINSLGQVCDINTCKDIDMYTMPIQTGQSICFKDQENNDFSIKIIESSIVARYIPIYYTSDWEVETKQYYKCKGTDECWQGTCHYNTKGKNHKNHDSVDFVHGCLTSSLGCDTTCWHQLSCTFFQWTVKQVGELFTVYKVENTLWQVAIQIKYKNTTKTAKLNVNNPSVGLEEFQDILGTKIPLYVTNFMSESTSFEPNLITHSGSITALTASSVNMPESDIIGDYQISLDMATRSLNYNDVECKVESCIVKCFHPLPKVRKLKNIAINNKDSSIEYKHNAKLEVILAEKRIMSTITLMIGNLRLKNLQVQPAFCQININTMYGCKGCNKLPILIYTPVNVKIEGALHFESNCSFEQNYLSCNSGPSTLKALEKYDACTIFIQKTNQTIVIKFEYEFLGTVEPNAYSISKTSLSDELYDIASNPAFWQTMLSTFTLFTFLSIFTSLAIRAFKVYEVRKIHNKA